MSVRHSTSTHMLLSVASADPLPLSLLVARAEHRYESPRIDWPWAAASLARIGMFRREQHLGRGHYSITPQGEAELDRLLTEGGPIVLPVDGIFPRTLRHLLLSVACAEPMTRSALFQRVYDRYSRSPGGTELRAALERLVEAAHFTRTEAEGQAGRIPAYLYAITPAGEAVLDALGLPHKPEAL